MSAVRGGVPVPRLSSPLAVALVALFGLGGPAASAGGATPTEMALAAAGTMQAAGEVLLEAKQELGIWPGPEIDPNRTGMLGQEFTAMTTTPGTLAKKRAATSPDFAAALVRLLAENGVGEGDKVLLIMSGSYLGADIAAIAALEALEATIYLIPSLGSSMWGANDPRFNLVDALSLLLMEGIIETGPLAGVIGGNAAIGTNMEPEVLPTLRASFARAGVRLVEETPVGAIIAGLAEVIAEAAGGAEEISLMVKVGGSAISLGSDPDLCDFPTGLQSRPPLCAEGVPGLLHIMGAPDARVLNIVDIGLLADELGFAFDPVPLPEPGENPRLYGGT